MAAFVKVPGLSGLDVKKITSAFKGSVKASDVLLGTAAGMVISQLVAAYANKKATADNVWGKLGNYAGPVGAVAAGVLAFAAQGGKGGAAGHLVGAVSGGVIPVVAAKIGEKAAEAFKLEGYVMAPMGRMGMIMPDASYGMILPDPAYGTLGESTREYQLSALRSWSDQNGEVEEYMA